MSVRRGKPKTDSRAVHAPGFSSYELELSVRDLFDRGFHKIEMEKERGTDIWHIVGTKTEWENG